MLPGFELLFSSLQSQLRSSQDAVVSAIHWAVISAGLKLTGVGENPSGGRHSTESLLEGWNVGEIYVLHYESAKDPQQRYLLKILPVETSLFLHFQRENEDDVFTQELSVQDFVTDDLSSVTTAFRDIDRLNSTVQKSLIDPAMGNRSSCSPDNPDPNKPGSSSQNPKEKKKTKKDPLMVGEPRRPPQPNWYGGEGSRGINPFSVGRSDLDPLAGIGGMGGGGGMIMDPRHSGGPRFGPEAGGGRFGGPGRGGGIPGNLPPGSVPPGARFDPVGPPGTRPGPDPDHERPPDYDDMFM